ncbi:MAG: BrnT family toxin [Pseudobdellovibrionaceae bacterium]|nr:BrnT family toxin [Bdellovibrionales bacterium]USN47776.1 MAG: BrnT family toxin [Pseudobdellovibrionaceae bacterium]
MQFEWDEAKNRSNYQKHGLWFEEAQTLWADAHSVEFFDPSSESEDRFIRVGHSSAARVLLVVFCERQDGGIIRIISARKATKKERQQYEEGI